MKDYEDLDEYVAKSGSYKNQSANHLLAFTYKDEEAANYNGIRRGGNFYGGRRRNHHGSQYLTKEHQVQASLKFIVKKEKDYLLNLYDPNELVEWKDVVSVVYNMANAEDVQCPICLENLNQMVTPKITKCGHIYCWPCVL